jgi:hypothetical protein
LVKGLAAAHLDYPGTEWRHSGDADLLVRRADLDRVCGALARRGFRRTELSLGWWWERRYMKAMVWESPSDVEVDVHAAIAVGYFGMSLDHDALTDRPSSSISLGGIAARGLGDASRFVTSCYAAVLGRGAQLRLLRDIAQQLLVTDIDWRRAVELARRGDGESVMATAMVRTAAVLGLDMSHEALAWAASVVPSRRARTALDLARKGETAGWSADARSALLALGPVDKARFLAGIAVPPPANRAARGRTLRATMRRARSFVRSTS